MKKIIQFPSCLILVALCLTYLSGCSLFDKIDDITFDATLTEYLEVADESTSQNVAYSEIVVIDATSDPEIEKYIDKIKEIKLKKLTYQIVSVSNTAPGTLFSGNLSLGDISGSSPSVVITITNLDINDLSTVHEVAINQNDINTVNSLLKSDKAVAFYLSGEISQTPVYANIEIVMDVEVDADAL